MDYSQKATISKKIKEFGMIIICIVGSISLLGLVMAIYSLVMSKYIFTLVYLIAVLLGFTYVVLRINAIMPLYVANNDEYMFIQNWDNGFFPFRYNKGLLGDYIPSAIELKSINISGISKIYMGTRNYLLKLVPEKGFYNNINNPEKKYESLFKKMEFLYVLTLDNKEIFIPVSDFDYDALGEVIKAVTDINENIEFKTNNRGISKQIPAKKITM